LVDLYNWPRYRSVGSLAVFFWRHDAMMKQLVLVGVLTALIAMTGVFDPSVAAAQTSSSATTLGTVRLPKTVKADGKPLPAGTYQVRLTNDEPKPAVGQAPGAERWVEFVKGG